jgi:hypothetical protein
MSHCNTYSKQLVPESATTTVITAPTHHDLQN